MDPPLLARRKCQNSLKDCPNECAPQLCGSCEPPIFCLECIGAIRPPLPPILINGIPLRPHEKKVTFQKEEPKMPHLIKNLYKEIDAHPRYAELDPSVKFAYEMACKNRFSHCTKENNAWCRHLWTKLYVDWDTIL